MLPPKHRHRVYCDQCPAAGHKTVIGRLTVTAFAESLLHLYHAETVQRDGPSAWLITCRHGHQTRWEGSAVVWKQEREAA